MPGRAQSNAAKQQAISKEYAKWEAHAVEAYKLGLQKPNGKGSHTVAREFKERIKTETGKDIVINYARLVHGARGVKSQAKENASRGWLSDSEVEVVIDYIIELGNHGFPLSHWRLKEHVNEILQA